MQALITWLNANWTKIIGYVAMGAGFIATADPALIDDLLGAKWQRWALLIVGLLTAVRGHQNTATEKVAAAQAELNKVKTG